MNAAPVSGPWKMTYYNPQMGQRCTLIDDIDEVTADAVLAQFGKGGDKLYRMPEVQKEFEGGAA